MDLGGEKNKNKNSHAWLLWKFALLVQGLELPWLLWLVHLIGSDHPNYVCLVHQLLTCEENFIAQVISFLSLYTIIGRDFSHTIDSHDAITNQLKQGRLKVFLAGIHALLYCITFQD